MPPCLLCSGPSKPCPVLGRLSYVRCERCGLVFSAKLAGADLRAEYEGGAYEERPNKGTHLEDEFLDQRRSNARSRMALVRRHAPSGGRLLDVGAASGAFVAEAVDWGFDALGLEPSPRFAAYAREVVGANVVDARLEDFGADQEPFAVVTLWHVMEHLGDPLAALGRVRDLLTAGGVVVLEVPNVTSVVAGVMGTRWPAIEPDVHVIQFSPPTLRTTLELAQLHVYELTTVSASVYLSPRARLRPGPMGERAKLALRGVFGLEHPTGHELLRAVAGAGPRSTPPAHQQVPSHEDSAHAQ